MFHSSKGLRVVLSMEWFQDSIVDSFLNCHLMSLPLQTKIKRKETGIFLRRKKGRRFGINGSEVEIYYRDILVIVTKQPW